MCLPLEQSWNQSISYESTLEYVIERHSVIGNCTLYMVLCVCVRNFLDLEFSGAQLTTLNQGGGVLLLRPRRGDGKKIERKNVLKVMQTYGL